MSGEQCISVKRATTQVQETRTNHELLPLFGGNIGSPSPRLWGLSALWSRDLRTSSRDGPAPLWYGRRWETHASVLFLLMSARAFAYAETR